jgi:anti-sigma factor RsiW
MHLTDEQLNEYLDHETNERAQIELHLATCGKCSARLAALQDLFSEIESLPELELSQDIAERARFIPGPSLPAKLPRSLTLTVTLQAMLTVMTIIVAAPFVMQFVSSYTPSLSAPSLVEVFMQLQGQWTTWLDALATLPVPALPDIPVVNVSSLFVMFTVIGVFLLWLVGNGLLLRNQMK